MNEADFTSGGTKGKRKKEKGIEIGTQLQENGSVGVSV
jgi:hypothetical protein